MTIAEARRLLGVTNNYWLHKRTGIPESTLARWKAKNNMIPLNRRDEVMRHVERK